MRLTLFTAILVQDSALTVSGLDRESSADHPFTLVDGVPTLVGRGLKGAAVAMAKRFFDPLPRAVSDDIKHGALRRSVWEFANATPMDLDVIPRLRAGVGIRHKTGARAKGVLYDREVIPAGTKWALNFRVDWSYAENESEAREAEGILGYVLAEHWAKGRCWLGGDVARGLGWCHLEDLKAYRLDESSYERWVQSDRKELPPPLETVPTVEPTRSWCFRTLDVELVFGEYQPNPDEPAWGLDMLAIGPHDAEGMVQPTGDGTWAKPSWVASETPTPEAIFTDRPILMDGPRPLIPGASVRGPLRHAFSRAERAAGRRVEDPHLVQGNVGDDDPGGRAFGTVNKSSRILIRDARAEGEWAAAKLHMHSEDEFSAGSYGTAKRDAVRLLKGVFPVRIVVEGPTPQEVEPMVELINRQVALGKLGHLPIGGHKTRGSGWGRWQPKGWCIDDVKAARTWTPSEMSPQVTHENTHGMRDFLDAPEPEDACVRIASGTRNEVQLTLSEAASLAMNALGTMTLVAWWCDPSIDLNVSQPPKTFGTTWPDADTLQVDEVAFYAERAVWRAVRTSGGARWVFIEEVDPNTSDGKKVKVVHVPARLHGFKRFSAANTGRGKVLLRQWYEGDEILGFTIDQIVQEED
jgi:CRISPR/Cas system CSM-associated protein Csm3 (group 7 of RAMP superfamily)